MVSKWVKAVFLFVIALVLLLYGDGFVAEMETQSSQQWNMSLDWTWDLVMYLIWILIAWLVVYASLTIAMSFKAEAYTLTDVMDRLEKIEKRLGPEKTRAGVRTKPDGGPTAAATEEDSVPPPPRE